MTRAERELLMAIGKMVLTLGPYGWQKDERLAIAQALRDMDSEHIKDMANKIAEALNEPT